MLHIISKGKPLDITRQKLTRPSETLHCVITSGSVYIIIVIMSGSHIILYRWDGEASKKEINRTFSQFKQTVFRFN